MNSEVAVSQEELERIKAVADMLCSAHAQLRDRFTRYAFWLDIIILALSTWLVALAFVAPEINFSLTPFGISPRIWTGILAVGTFFLTIVQLKSDLKGKSDAHRRSCDIYAGVTRECRYVLSSGNLSPHITQRVVARYDMATDVSVPIPEKEFLKQKKRHRLKVSLSRYLDDRPGASLIIARLKFFLRDNMR